MVCTRPETPYHQLGLGVIMDRSQQCVGGRYLAASGRVWTVTMLTRRGNRIVLTSPGPLGPRGAVMDQEALDQMIQLGDESQPRSAASDHINQPQPSIDRTRASDIITAHGR